MAFAGGFDLTIPHSFAIGIGLLIGGIVLILIAIVLIVLGARTRPRPQSRPGPDQATGVLARPGHTGREVDARTANAPDGSRSLTTGWRVAASGACWLNLQEG